MRLTLLALIFVTGIVDAVAFLGLGQVFAAMQTGNVIFLGFGVAGAAEASLAAPLITLLAFLAGGRVAALNLGEELLAPAARRRFAGLGGLADLPPPPPCST